MQINDKTIFYLVFNFHHILYYPQIFPKFALYIKKIFKGLIYVK